MSTPEFDMTNCPTEETLAAFIDKRLDGPARRKVIEHMSVCGDCRAIVTGAFDAALEQVSPEPAAENSRPIARKRTRWFMALAAGLAAIVLIPLLSGRFDSGRRMRALAADAERGTYRAVEARLSGPFKYRPLPKTFRGPRTDLTVPSRTRLLATAAEIEEESLSKPTAANLHALGVSQLLLGDVEAAIKALEQARTAQELTSTRSEDQAAVLNDLAVSYFERGKRKNDPRDFFRASEFSERSWALSPSAPAAWTRAVAYERMRARDAARTAWNDYLRLDQNSEWSTEARQRLSALDEPSASWERERPVLTSPRRSHADAVRIVRLYPYETRILAEEDLLGRWASDQLQGRIAEAEAHLAASESIGAALAATTGDLLVHNAVRVIRESKADAGRINFVASAHDLYARGKEAYRRRDTVEAERLLRAARVQLDAAGSSVAFLATVYHAGALFFQNRYRDVGPAIAPAEGACTRRYLAACGLHHWITGLALVESGRYVAASKAFANAHDSFASIGERQNIAAVLQLKAEALTYLSAEEEAWTDRYEAMVASNGSLGRPVIWADAAKAAIAGDFPRTAHRLLSMIAEATLERNDYMSATDALTWRALASSKIDGRHSAADLRLASALATNIGDRAVRDRASANLQLVTTMTATGSDPERVDDALAFYRDAGHSFAAIELLTRRAASRRNAGDLAGALADITAACEATEEERKDIRDPFLLTLFNDRRRALLLAAADIAAAQRRYTESLAYSDRSRTINFELHASHPARDFAAALADGTQLLQAIPPGVVVIQQELFPTKLATWLARRGSIEYYERAISGEDIEAAVSRLCTSLRENAKEPVIARQGRDVYEQLLESLENRIGAGEVVVYSPGRELRHVPVAALWGSRGSLLRERAVALTRSVSSIVGSPPARSMDGGVLVLSGTAPSEMAELAAARKEVADVGRLYRKFTEVNADDSDARSTFLSRIAECDVIHVAGHATVEQRPLENAMLFRDQRIAVYDLLELRLPRSPVVVLAGCGTDSEHSDSGLSVASAFRAAGASAVIASSVAVEDQATRRLLVDFHSGLAVGIPAIDALRSAQLKAAARGDSPSAWAGFHVLL